jgi:transposase
MNISKKVVRMGIDLSKPTFHVLGVAKSGSTVVKKKWRRKPWREYFANRPPCLVGMEACGGSHHWARELIKLGHEVRLISPQFVKPYIQRTEHAYHDAEGICEVVG